MNQEEIAESARLAWQEVERCKGEVEVALARARVIMALCEHPNQYRTSHMGESGTYCPDCRKQS